ncbi:MAG: sodium/proton-translocating pyrophosphatase, partial [Bacillota bacterium]|nr:sodium/proton-translocating pyrophosphatase [Bacillota bacterium]
MIPWMAPAAALLAFLAAGRLYRSVLRSAQGDPAIMEISGEIRRGAVTYLRRQTESLSRFVILLALLFALLGVLGVEGFPLVTSLGFLLGAGASMAAGWASMMVATRANGPTVEAARRQGRGALGVAYGAGGSIGLLVVGAGLGSVLLGIGLFGLEDHLVPLTALALGASTVAL